LSFRANHLPFEKLRFSNGFGMIRDLLKWVAPGVVTVMGGTVAALAMATPAMLETLAEEGRSALDAAGAEWAHIDLSGRGVHLTGTTSSDAERDLAMTSLASLPGVSWVGETVTIAPLATPFRINVSVENGFISLFGSVPNETFRQELLAVDGLASADLQIRSGQPDEAAWRRALVFALGQAALVESGYFELSGLTLNAVGRASSEKALGALQMALAEAPDGLTIGRIDVEPVRVAPYVWRAEFDGERIAISGHVPEERVADRLRLADVSGLPIATGLSLASGAPDGFAEQSKLLVEQLARLERGEAEIVDGASRLTGVPPSVEIAQAVTEALSGTGSIVNLSPPQVADYWVSINRQPGGVLVFDGFVPDETTRDDFEALPGADVSFLKFGAGAPKSYRAGVDFGLSLLDHVSEGRFSLAGDAVSISGIARSPTDYRALLDLTETALPQGLALAQMGIEAPYAATYAFSVSRDAGGGIVLEGMLPSPDVEASLLASAGPNARSRVTYASGEAPNFLASVEQALDLLPWLRVGSVQFDGTGWTVAGEPLSAIDKGSIETEFAVRGLAQSGWSLALSAPSARPGFADPYLWSAERLLDGSFLFAGNVPAASLQSWLKVHVGTRVADTSAVANGAPEGFADAARAAVDALLALEQGRASYDGSSWNLTGSAADATAREIALAEAEPLALATSPEIAVPEPAAVEPYLWSAVKTEDTIVLEGSVPVESLQRFLSVRAGESVEDKTVLRTDAPDNFASETLQAMDVLALMKEGRVTFDGAGWSATGTSLAAGASAEASALLGTSAPRWKIALEDPAPDEVEVAEVAAPAPEEMPPEPVAEPVPPYAFKAVRSADGAVILSGQVPAVATASYLSTIADADADALIVDPNAPTGFMPNLLAGMRSLLQTRQGQLELIDGAWSLSGEAVSRDALSAIETEIASLGSAWAINVTAPSGLAQCQARLAELSAHNAILFQSGAAIIAAGAGPELDAFAEALLLCPDAAVEVEGHTDADGDDQLNLALSVARAEAVVGALIERGVSPARLYAIGYGESRPVADNETADGKRRNRRIVVSVRAD
jgi:OOP family OmpA-OmpF porin